MLKVYLFTQLGKSKHYLDGLVLSKLDGTSKLVLRLGGTSDHAGACNRTAFSAFTLRVLPLLCWMICGFGVMVSKFYPYQWLWSLCNCGIAEKLKSLLLECNLIVQIKRTLSGPHLKDKQYSVSTRRPKQKKITKGDGSYLCQSSFQRGSTQTGV